MKALTVSVALVAAAVLFSGLLGCANHKPKPYGQEFGLEMPGERQEVWAIAPTLNLSGASHVDPLLQSDLIYQELQKVQGLTVIPVNRVAEIYTALRIDKVQDEQQANEVCKLLGCDGLIVPTVTAYDPYNPPKMGAALQLFHRPQHAQQVDQVDPHELERSPTAGGLPEMTSAQHLLQAVGMFDAADGTMRARAAAYAAGRTDPNGPLAAQEIFLSMDRYCGFVYHELIEQLLEQLQPQT